MYVESASGSHRFQPPRPPIMISGVLAKILGTYLHVHMSLHSLLPFGPPIEMRPSQLYCGGKGSMRFNTSKVAHLACILRGAKSRLSAHEITRRLETAQQAGVDMQPEKPKRGWRPERKRARTTRTTESPVRGGDGEGDGNKSTDASR
jgi:hypothetical protein